jgi:HEAT repeat protein
MKHPSIYGPVVLLVLAVAVPARAQISGKQIKERYERNTTGSSIDDYVRNLNSDDPAKRLQGVKSLTTSKDAKAIEYLLQAVGDDDVRVKAKAIDGLADLRATEATPVLIQQLFLRSTEPFVEQRILACLGKIGDPRATQPILEFLQQDLDPETKGTAIYALGDIGSPEAIAPLAAIEQTEENPTLQRIARQAAAKVRYQQAVMKTEAKQPLDTFLRPSEQEQQQQQAPQ